MQHMRRYKYDGATNVDQQTAWGAGTQFITSGQLAMYFNYCKTRMSEDPNLIHFSIRNSICIWDNYATCFLDWDSTAGMVEWTLAEGTYSFEIWAAAGQCDTDKGTLTELSALTSKRNRYCYIYNVQWFL
jgi:hypothetical protein